MSHFIKAIGVFALALGSIVVPATANQVSAAAPGGGCLVSSFVPDRGHIIDWRATPTVTLVDQVTIGAHTTRSVTVEQTVANTVTASATLNAQIKGSASLLWASVEVTAGTSVARQGQRTSSTKITETVTITNTSGSNRTYVYFHGVSVYTGRYYRDFCRTVSGGNPGVIYRVLAPFRTFAKTTGRGNTFCEASASSALERAAQRFCR